MNIDQQSGMMMEVCCSFILFDTIQWHLEYELKKSASAVQAVRETTFLNNHLQYAIFLGN